MTSIAAPFSRVLVPYDGSDPAKSALKHALTLVADGTELCILTVVDDTPIIAEAGMSVTAYDPSSLFEAMDREGSLELDDAVQRCHAKHVNPVTELVHDTTVRAILSTAEKHASDLIVMGSHGRTGLSRLFLGSTTAGVLRECIVPVLVVR
jgi:nucleotide-binding universal stress UspA family protein